MNLFFAAMLVMQANWIPAGSVPQGSYAYNASSISRSGGNVRVQLRIILSAPEEHGVMSLVMNVEFGCAGRTMTIHHVSGYDAAGSVIQSRDMQGAELVAVPITANMLEQSIMQRLCT